MRAASAGTRMPQLPRTAGLQMQRQMQRQMAGID